MIGKARIEEVDGEEKQGTAEIQSKVSRERVQEDREACLEPYVNTGANRAGEEGGGRRRSKVESGLNSVAGFLGAKHSLDENK